MRLLYTKEIANGHYEIKEFTESETPRYAILSHTWEQGEVTLQDMEGDLARAKEKEGFHKIEKCGLLAWHMGYEWIWIDTFCIDKTSSAELSEAINSMYKWYEQAGICFAYLADVPQKEMKNSRWFTRGWTLQELIAPANLEFFDAMWMRLGSKEYHLQVISDCTSIPASLFSGESDVDDFCIAQKMSWAANRSTSRIEDRAYSLLGLFGVHIPLIYGEGENAFVRLQEEIMRVTDDHTLFAWRHEDNRAGLLAVSPDAFADSHDIIPFVPFGFQGDAATSSSRGIYLELNFTGIGGEALGIAILHCKYKNDEGGLIAIYLKDTSLTMKLFRRVSSANFSRLDLTKFKPYPYPLRRICIEAGHLRRKRKQSIEQWNIEAEKHVYPSDKVNHLMTREDPADLLLDAACSGDNDSVWLLLTRSHIELDSKANSGRTPLECAIRNGHKAIVEMLLEKGASIDMQDSSGKTLLSVAVGFRGHKDIVKLLLDRNAKVNEEDGKGYTPLLSACENGDVAIVSLLLDRNAEPNQKNSKGYTPLLKASEIGDVAISRMLLDRGANTEERRIYPQPGTSRITSLTCLLLATSRGNEAIVKLLLERGAKIEARDFDDSHSTSLLLATADGNETIVKLLLENGADIEANDTKNRSTPLLVATIKGNESMVDLLLEYGAKPDVQDRKGRTPLLLATINEDESMTNILLNNGAKSDLRDHKGQTPLFLATQKGNMAIMKLLQEHTRAGCDPGPTGPDFDFGKLAL